MATKAKDEAVAVAAGSLQPGESVAAVTTRVPRGVGEPASDAIAEHEGVAAAQRGVQATADAEAGNGFSGLQVDPTPNEAYTLRGVGKGLPTPETTPHTPRSY